MTVWSRLTTLERRGCRACRDAPQRPVVFYPEHGDPTPEPERCPKCHRPLGPIIRVEYGPGLGGGR
jgi:hypothetical protein